MYMLCYLLETAWTVGVGGILAGEGKQGNGIWYAL